MTPARLKRLVALAGRQAKEILLLANPGESDDIIAELVNDLEPLLLQALLTEKADEPLTRAKIRRILGVLGLLQFHGFGWAERFGKRVEWALVDRVTQSALLVGAHVRQQLAIVYPSVDWIPVPRSATAPWLAKAQSWGARYRARAAEDIRRQFLAALPRGETIGGMIRRLFPGSARRAQPPRGESLARTLARGLASRLRAPTGLLLQNEASSAYHDIYRVAVAESDLGGGGIKRRWDATMDAKTCAVCRGLDGQIATLDGLFSDGSTGPPAHPRCRCTVTLWAS